MAAKSRGGWRNVRPLRQSWTRERERREMATENKFKRGDRVRLVGRDETMTVMHVEDTEAGIYYVTCFSREDGGAVTFYSDQLSLVETFDCLGRSVKAGGRR